MLASLDDLPPGDPRGRIQPIGCTLGPGCGCLGLPLALLAGIALSTVFALAWVLRLGRTLGAVARMATRRRGGPG